MDYAYEEARKKVKRKKKFFKELSVYVPTALGLMVLNITTNPGHYWFLWAIGPWGLVLIMRGLGIIIEDKTSGWEEREMKKELTAMGKDPDKYFEKDYLELKDYDQAESQVVNRKGYKDSDFV